MRLFLCPGSPAVLSVCSVCPELLLAPRFGRRTVWDDGAAMSVSVARAGADLRLLRAAVFAAVCVALSAGGHVLASCAGLPLWALGAGFLGVFAAIAPSAGRERSLPAISAGLAVAQLTLHALFEFAQRATAVAAPARQSSDAMLIKIADRLMCGEHGRLTAAEARRIVMASGIAPSGHLSHWAQMGEGHPRGGHAAESTLAAPSLAGALVPSLPMLLGHLLAAIVLGLLMRRGEAALFQLVRLSARGIAEGALGSLRSALTLVCLLCRELLGAPVIVARGPRTHGHGKTGKQSLVLEHSVSRRGPPSFALAA
jgi:hypothetical protein